MGRLGLWDSFLITLRSARGPTHTVAYPAVQRKRPARFRASFSLRHDEHGEELCVACLICEKVCPSQAIRVKVGAKRDSPVTGKKRLYADDFTLDLSACLQCELCVQVCPQDAIGMVGRPELPCASREDLVLTMPRLYLNEAVPASWATGSRLMEMQEPPKPLAAAPAAPAAPEAPAAPPTPVPGGAS